MRITYLLLFSLLLPSFLIAQNKYEVRFIKHLTDKGYFKEALRELERIDWNNYSSTQNDSLYHFKGWSHYALKQLNKSTSSLTNVGYMSSFYSKSQTFAIYNQMHLGNYSHATQLLNHFQPKNNNEDKLRLYLKAGKYLLERDYKNYQLINNKIDHELFAYAKEINKIESISNNLQSHKKKSPLLAGIMSGIIPGSGKIYANKTGEGIASMLMVSSLGLVTYENYRKLGAKHFKTILFGSIFTILYVGNIYGSVFSVKISNEEYNHEMDQKILFNLHIPLRTFFN